MSHLLLFSSKLFARRRIGHSVDDMSSTVLKDKICIKLWDTEESKKNGEPNKLSLCANQALLREESENGEADIL